MKHLLIRAHAPEGLRALPDESVHCVVTSPPYFGLRDYQTPAVAWGDGWRGHLGLEPTPERFIVHLIEIFSEVRRVLRSDGTAFVVLGDSYAGSWGSQGHRETPASMSRNSIRNHPKRASLTGTIKSFGLQSGDLYGIPWRFAFAAQVDGWILRSGIVWAKKSCMPESVTGTRWERHRIKVAPAAVTRQHQHSTSNPRHFHPDASGGVINAPRAEWQDCPGCDRCAPNGGLVLRRGSWRPTSAHEYIFMLAKSGDYFADGEELREEAAPSTIKRGAAGYRSGGSKMAAERRDGNSKPNGNFADYATNGANLRSVWHLGPEPFPDAHSAVFPSEIPRRAILAGTSSGGCCAECGAPWARVLSVERSQESGSGRSGKTPSGKHAHRLQGGGETLGVRCGPVVRTRSAGFRPTCSCPTGAPAAPVVLDPFAGSGTTGKVALALGRRFIGFDLSAAYLFGIARERVRAADVGASLGEPLRLRTIEGPLFS